MSREQHLAAAFVELVDTLVDDYDVVDLLDRLAGHSVRLLGVTAAGLLLDDQRGGGLRVLAASSEQTRLLELFQLQTDQGPCLDCVHTGQPVSVPDLADATARWPRFAPVAVRQGFRAVHALPLRLRNQTIGALNLFHDQPTTLTADELRLGQALADAATIGILHERAVRRGETLIEQLQTALNSRVIIEQAKGFLADRGGLDVDQAFNLLRRYARDHNLRLSDTARRVVEDAHFVQVVLHPSK
jgi:GAF domain-containing protein